jgi:subtilisin family serine protease
MIPLRLPLTCLAWLCAAALVLSACGGGGHGSGAVPAPATTSTAVGIVPGTQPTTGPSPASTPGSDAAAYVCPTSDTASAATGQRAAGAAESRMLPRRAAAAARSTATTQLLAVTYDARTAAAQRTALGARETALGARLTATYTFRHANLVTHVLRVSAASAMNVAAALRAQSGVRSVAVTGTRRYPTAVSAPYFPNDPYFTGFATPVAPTAGAAVPGPTFKALPLIESANVPGQWDMHVTRLEYAFAYSQAGNGSGVVPNAAALGSTSVKIAVIDTGQDTTHPELAGKIVYQRCFVTNLSDVQSTSAFTTDEDGHGTDVAGIAGEATSNGLGFSGAGGNVKLYGYRVFPTPDDSCASDTSTDAQCGTDTRDIASAIEDAVTSHVNVISLSLGGSPCNADGSDSDPVEGAAIADAIAANIVVVAAAGNGAGPPLEAPACDPGVIAVGATALADGTPNATGKSGGSAGAPFEYVASYSDSGTPGAAPHSATAWGIVAPGGDPTDANDTDDLHWIDNIWTSTPFGGSTGDTKFTGDCKGDYPSESGTADCRTFIAGTSMATPHVAGAAALIISVNPSYQNPTAMKQLLCTTAADIGDASEGCGRLDVYRAMATALHDNNIPASSPIP